MEWVGPQVSRPVFEAEVGAADERVTRAWRAYGAAMDLLLFGCDGTCGRDPHRLGGYEALRALRARWRVRP